MNIDMQITSVNKTDSSLWIACCAVMNGGSGLSSPEYREWLHVAMRHSGVDNSVCFYIRTQAQFSLLMKLYEHLKLCGFADELQIASNTMFLVKVDGSEG